MTIKKIVALAISTDSEITSIIQLNDINVVLFSKWLSYFDALSICNYTILESGNNDIASHIHLTQQKLSHQLFDVGIFKSKHDTRHGWQIVWLGEDMLQQQKKLQLVPSRLDYYLGLYNCFEENAADLKRLYEIDDFGDAENELMDKVVSSLDWLKESILVNGYRDSCIGLLQDIDKLCKDYGIKL
jgi:hypothetical protein